MPAVEVSQLVVRYGTTTAVDGVSFTADFGEVVCVLGPNGAGKTTTVETLEGYRAPAGGLARVLGYDPHAERDRITPSIGVMLQRGGVYPAMSAAQALRLYAAFYEHPEPADDLIALLDLGPVATRPWRRLSGGEQQRVCLALALVGRPRVAFLDEPSAGVDALGRRVIWDVVRGLRERGACVVLTTHHLEEAERLADRVVIIDGGQVVTEGTPAQLTAAAGADVRFSAPPALDTAALAAHVGASVVEERPGEYRVEAAASPALVAAITSWLAERDLSLGDLRAGRQRLEDVFVRLMEERR